MITYTCTAAPDVVAQSMIASIEANNMRLVSHINGQANAARMGKTVPADQILEVFRPDFAIRVWQCCKPAGIEIPLRIHLYEDDSGNVIVTYRTAREIFQPYQSQELMKIGDELDEIFLNILRVLGEEHAEVSYG